MARNLAAFGLYPSMSSLHTGVEALKSAGFRQTDISVLYPDRCTREYAHDEPFAARTANATADSEEMGMAGGILGYLAGIGALTIPGIGPLLAAGPIVSSLGAANTTGGLIGALAGLGIPEPEAERYQGRLRDGGLLLSVHCDDGEWAVRGTHILTQTGADAVATGDEKVADYLS